MHQIGSSRGGEVEAAAEVARWRQQQIGSNRGGGNNRLTAAMDCTKLAATEVDGGDGGSNRLKAATDCSGLAAAEVEAAADWGEQWIAADWQQQRWRQ